MNVICFISLQLLSLVVVPPQWGTADAELKVPSVENTELKDSPFKAWGRSVLSHTYMAARDFFLANFYPSGPFTCIFFQNLSQVFNVLATANTGSCVGPQNKIGHLAGCRFLVECPRDVNRLKNMTCGKMTCEMNNWETE